MPNSAISFNTAGLASATSPGLVGTGAQTFAGKKTLDGGALIKGDTSGAAIAAGYVGENTPTVSASGTAQISSSAAQNIVQLTSLPAGIWILYASIDTINSSGISAGGITASLTTTTTAVSGFPDYNTISLLGTLNNQGRLACSIPPLYVNSTTSTGPYYVTLQMVNYVSGTQAARARILAVRIA